MNTYDFTKINTEYRSGFNCISPFMNKKYTLTHDDNTSKLFVTVDNRYANDKYNKTRDEVIGAFKFKDNNLVFLLNCLVDDKDINFKEASIRNEIFKREMKLAIISIIYGDYCTFNKEVISNADIIVCFNSKYIEYNMCYNYGKIKKYINIIKKEYKKYS